MSYNSRIVIDGITEHQRILLDTMWEKDTSAELYAWMETLTPENWKTVQVLIDMIQLAYIDQEVDCTTDLSWVYDSIMECKKLKKS